MNIVMLINLVLGLLRITLSNLKANSTTAELQSAANAVSEAIAQLEQVIGTPVTYTQLESLRAEPKW